MHAAARLAPARRKTNTVQDNNLVRNDISRRNAEILHFQVSGYILYGVHITRLEHGNKSEHYMENIRIALIEHATDFPPQETALKEPDGLLGFGLHLHPKLVSEAYCHGIFPWFNQGEPVLWWCPSERAVIEPDRFRLTRSLAKRMRNSSIQITLNRAFPEVIKCCSTIERKGQDATWITAQMIEVYTELHHQGVAHSLEAWLDNRLVGGLYGILRGSTFCGESMFSQVNDASKLCLAQLCTHAETFHLTLIDCQVINAHLLTLGATTLPRAHFLNRLEFGLFNETGNWSPRTLWPIPPS